MSRGWKETVIRERDESKECARKFVSDGSQDRAKGFDHNCYLKASNQRAEENRRSVLRFTKIEAALFPGLGIPLSDFTWK